MKRIVFAVAIILISLNITSCTRVPITENTELGTGGELENNSDNPDDD